MILKDSFHLEWVVKNGTVGSIIYMCKHGLVFMIRNNDDLLHYDEDSFNRVLSTRTQESIYYRKWNGAFLVLLFRSEILSSECFIKFTFLRSDGVGKARSASFRGVPSRYNN